MQPSPANPTKTVKPESLEAKFKLLGMLPYDERVRRRHCLVFGFVLDWYHPTYGDALASVRHVVDTIKLRDPNGKGLGQTYVHSTLSDLVMWGYLHCEKGKGKLASRYIPNWSLICADRSVHPILNGSESEPSVHPVLKTGVHPVLNATLGSVHSPLNEDPSTPNRVLDPETGIDGQDCAAPLAPPADGPSATAAGPAQGFKELWDAYDHRRAKKEARAAYDKLAPEADLHALVVKAARRWQEAWAAQRNPYAPRIRLDIWIRDERYDEDPPSAFKPKERKAKPQSGSVEAPQLPDRHLHPVRILRAKEIGSSFEKNHSICLTLEGLRGAIEGKEITHTLHVLSRGGRETGYQPYQVLRNILGETKPADAGGRIIGVLNLRDGGLGFSQASREDVVAYANDNANRRAA